MARIRTIKPSHWSDKELAKISLQAHLLWIGLWNFSDDDGVFEGDPLLIKSQLFPRRTDIKVDQINQWLDQLVKARFLIHFEYKNEIYYVSRTFKNHQRIDKPQPGIIPDNELVRVFQEHSKNVPRIVLPVEYSIVKESNGSGMESFGGKPPAKDFDRKEKELLKEFEQLAIPDTTKDAWSVVKNWITENKPTIIEPYITVWNIYASSYKLSSVSKINETRRKKFSTRIKSSDFDFFEILSKASKSEFLKTSNWFNFDWIIENEMNYLQILEGKYN